MTTMFSAQEAINRLCDKREIFYDEMVDLMRQVMEGKVSQVQLAAAMLQELCLPDDIDLTVVFDSAFDANVIHRVCRERGFRSVFPLDPNRTLSTGAAVEAAGWRGHKVVAWTRSWAREEFTLLTLQVANEDRADTYVAVHSGISDE